MPENPIRARRQELGLKQAEAARLIGMEKNQLYKLETGRLKKIPPEHIPGLERVLKMTVAQMLGQQPLHGFTEPEARFLHEPDLGDLELRAARVLYPGRHADTMIVGAPSLLLKGYAPGDRILVDMALKPELGNCVVAQVYDEEVAAAETVLRVYQPPVLVPATADVGRFKTYVIDDSAVKIMGVIVNRYGPLQEQAA